MINTFWNLCRACPSVPAEKLHSEYRSTFRWHDYVGSGSGLSNHHHYTVVRQPSITAEVPAQGFWSGGQGGGPQERRGGKRVNISNVNTSVNGSGGGWWLVKSSSDALRLEPQATVEVAAQRFAGGRRPKLESHQPSTEESSGRNPPKTLSMGIITAPGDSYISYPKQHYHQGARHQDHLTIANNNNVPAGVTRRIDKPKATMEWTEHTNNRTEQPMSHSYEAPSGAAHLEEAKLRREYKSEYKKQFRPFSQYEYVDGRFFKKKSEQEMGINPWYKEVIELRKKAGEYRHRGWGTDFQVPQHLSAAYHENLWDQVSRRSSLAALALITTTTQRTITARDEKDKENARKGMPKRPMSRPATATPKHPISDFRIKELDAVHHGANKSKVDGPLSSGSNRASRAQARSQSAGPGGRSPGKLAAAHSILSKEKESPKPPQPRVPRPSSADPSLGFSEPVIKSPPEPTRVKSPDQVILRSPDPVNWTVPLDITKSFTVTQNIRDAPPSPRFRAGDNLESRSSSTKASSPLSSNFSPRTNKPPGSGQSQPSHAAPGLNKATASNKNSSGSPSSAISGSKTKTSTPPLNLNSGGRKLETSRNPDDNKNNNSSSATKAKAPPPSSKTTIGKPIPGTNLQCLDDPQFTFDAPVKNPPPTKPNVSVVPTHSTTKPGGIKVLEAPSSGGNLSFVPPPPVAGTGIKMGGLPSSQVSESLPPSKALPSYKVLDAPDSIETYKPQHQSPSQTQTQSSPVASASAAGKTKHKFDFKFWGKNKDNNSEKP